MNDPRDNRQLQAERYVRRLVAGLPDRSAPPDLVARVLERAAREQRAWWRTGFAHWPPLARLLFLPLAIAAAALAVLVSSRLWPLWDDLAASAPVRALGDVGRGLAACGHAAQSSFGTLAGLLPAGATSVVALVVVAAYAMFFGLGATAFRTLYAPHRTT
jgi:hypothetical protein